MIKNFLINLLISVPIGALIVITFHIDGYTFSPLEVFLIGCSTSLLIHNF